MSEGIVYIIGEDVPLPTAVKIGWTVALPARLSSLQTSAPTRLKVFRAIECTRPTEQWMHDHFFSRRLKGEWFRFCPDMLTIQPPRLAPKAVAAAVAVEVEVAVKRRDRTLPAAFNGELMLGKKDTHGPHFDYATGKWGEMPPMPRFVVTAGRSSDGPMTIVVRPKEDLVIGGATLRFPTRTTVSVSGLVEFSLAKTAA